MRRPANPQPRPHCSGVVRVGLPGRRGAVSPPAHGAAARSIWLISFTDLMCLLLAFFVLAFSMSEPEQHHWQALTHALTARRIGEHTGAVFNTGQLDGRAPINLDYLGTLLIGQFADSADMAGVVPVRQDDRVVIALPDTLLFEAGQAAFSERGRRILFVLGGVLGRVSNRIEVTGHIGLEQPTSDGERDAWELSLSRAVAVGTALHQAGYQRHLVVRSVAADVVPVQAFGHGPQPHLIDVVVRDLDEGA